MTIEEYKYLGIKQATSLNHTNIKKDITKQFQKRLIALLKTELKGKNISKAINTFAIPDLMYSYGIIKWSNTDLESLQRKIRTILTKYGDYHPNANAERMTLPRCEGGRGISDVKNLHNKQIINLRNYFYQRRETALYQVIIKADKKYIPVDLANENLVI
jgi:hypothetical protein